MITLADLQDGYTHDVECATCQQPMVAVDRYASDAPPGPRGRVPEAWVEFYRDSGCDPDDRLMECPCCDAELWPSTVQVKP